MDSLLLDRNTWDLTLDPAGNIAVATGTYALEQNVATACRLWQGELWYDTTKGVPYRDRILGGVVPMALVRAKLIAAALTVPGVKSAQVVNLALGRDRKLTGTVQFQTIDGSTGVTLL